MPARLSLTKAQRDALRAPPLAPPPAPCFPVAVAHFYLFCQWVGFSHCRRSAWPQLAGPFQSSQQIAALNEHRVVDNVGRTENRVLLH